MLDGAVLAGRIHGLEHQQQRPVILGVEHVLLLGEPFDAALEYLLGLALVLGLEATGVPRIDILEPEVLTARDAVRRDVLLDPL